MSLAIALSIVVSFAATLVLIRPAMRSLRKTGILGVDQQKPDKPRIPSSGGVAVIAGILAGVFFFIGLDTFIFQTEANLEILLAAAFSILITTLVGFFDDLVIDSASRKDKGMDEYRLGLRQWQKPLLIIPAAIPLMAVSAGTSTVWLPFIGEINFGILYPLLLVPIGVLCVTNATNMLAGMNGLEAGLGLVTTASLGLYSLYLGRVEAAAISLTAAAALLVFLFWNWHPARILPGDSLTYLIGGAIISAVVIGNIEKFGIIVFALWIAEALLKLRSGFKARSLGDLQPDGKLKAPYKRVYSLTHVVMKAHAFTERQASLILILTQAIICLFAFWFVLSF
ncbi:MAG: hypothetical protein HY367_02335 [Candidatus Aenigmarchaeota archaeon]|nr:hypothetical protein [Candidatus Aenigmarchaeota archaeon]